MRKVIPEHVDLYCDRCGNCCTDSKHRTQLRHNFNAPDIHWNYNPIPTCHYDLCDLCAVAFGTFMKNE